MAMRSGYLITLKGFVPADPRDPEAMAKAAALVAEKGFADRAVEVIAAMEPGFDVSAKFVNKRSGGE